MGRTLNDIAMLPALRAAAKTLNEAIETIQPSCMPETAERFQEIRKTLDGWIKKDLADPNSEELNQILKTEVEPELRRLAQQQTKRTKVSIGVC